MCATHLTTTIIDLFHSGPVQENMAVSTRDRERPPRIWSHEPDTNSITIQLATVQYVESHQEQKVSVDIEG